MNTKISWLVLVVGITAMATYLIYNEPAKENIEITNKQNKSTEVTTDPKEETKEPVVKNNIKEKSDLIPIQQQRLAARQKAQRAKELGKPLMDNQVKQLEHLLSDDRVPVESFFANLEFNEPTVEDLEDKRSKLAYEKREQTRVLRSFIQIVDEEVVLFRSAMTEIGNDYYEPIYRKAEDRLRQLEQLHKTLRVELEELESLNI